MFLPAGSTPSLMGFATRTPSYARSGGANTLRANSSCDPAALPTAGARSMLVRIPADEAVPVRHLHFRQGLGVHRLVVADDLVAGENIGGQRIDLVAGQRLRLRPWHRAPGEVEDRGGVRYIERHGPFRFAGGVGERRVAAAFTVLAVAGFAFLRVDGGALCGRAAARRQALAVRAAAHLPQGATSLAQRRPQPGRTGGA